MEEVGVTEEIGEATEETPLSGEVPHVAADKLEELGADPSKATPSTGDLDTPPTPPLSVAGPTGFMGLRQDDVKTVLHVPGRISRPLHNRKLTSSEFRKYNLT